jgi:NCS1 family nucleobase:cation symporter-1
MPDATRAAGVEAHSIYPIPFDQRHGTGRDLFTIWFGINLIMLTVATGALAPTVFHLPFLASILAIAIGIWLAPCSSRCTLHRGRISACRR